MRTSRLAGWLLLCALAAPAAAQATAEQKRLVDQLAGPQRDEAHRQLVAFGRRTVSALIDGLDDPRPEVVRQVLAILGELGPDAKPAVPVLLAKVSRSAKMPAVEWVDALADLAPFRPTDLAIDFVELGSLAVRLYQAGGDPDQKYGAAMSRLRTRLEFPVALGLSDLAAATRSYQPYRVETAVELLARRGPAARSSLPDLMALLQRSDPRVLPTDRTVPIRSKAARAILSIDPDGAEAAAARAVLTDRLPVPAAAVVPERTRARLAELIVELSDSRKREAAAANLAALGPVAVAVLSAALADDHDCEFREAALSVLRELGPRAADAVPVLFDVLTKWPAENLVSVMRTLTATAPWCRDVLPTLWYGGGPGHLVLNGRQVCNVDAALCDAFYDAGSVLYQVLRVDPGSALPELQDHLGSKMIVTREAALAVLRQRGAQARPLLPVIGGMLEGPQPQREAVGWVGGGHLEERSDVVHRLAAEAILAIAAPDDPLVAKAQQVLAQPPAKSAEAK